MKTLARLAICAVLLLPLVAIGLAVLARDLWRVRRGFWRRFHVKHPP